MSYLLGVAHEIATAFGSNQLIVLVCSGVAGIVAMLSAGRKS